MSLSVKEFKYLGEWITWNERECKAMESRKNKFELAFQLTSFSWGSKIKSYAARGKNTYHES